MTTTNHMMLPMRRVTTHVIITCANRMSRPIPQHLQLGRVHGATPQERAQRWIARLAQADSTLRVTANELYAGEHWSVARQFPTMQLPGEQIQLWSCSASYGLIPADTQIVPHHATLTRGQADSVPGDTASWWSMLSEWEGPAPGRPRDIGALVADEPDAVFMLVLSKNYLRACGADAAMACATVAHPDQFFIVSAGGRPEGSLATFTVPADARFQAHFGGTRRALNARIAADLLERGIRSKAEATEYLGQLLASQAPVVRYNRRKQSDGELLDLIAARLAQTSASSAHRMLRELRDAGLACEQRRFTRLYREASARAEIGVSGHQARKLA
jgi:hypothetical protein